jgi:hypothetical protein
MEIIKNTTTNANAGVQQCSALLQSFKEAPKSLRCLPAGNKQAKQFKLKPVQ